MFLIACTSFKAGNRSIFKEVYGVEPELAEYLEDFKSLTGPHYSENKVKGIGIGFVGLEGETVGLCKRYTINGGVEILIDTISWKYYNKSIRTALMLHELGHCLCDLDHMYQGTWYSPKEEHTMDKGFFEDGCPASLMYPHVITGECYDKHKDAYRYEIRQRCKRDDG